MKINIHIDRLISAASKNNLNVKVLGKIGGLPILLLTPKKKTSHISIMASAGFHGEEIAGCYGMLDFLENKFERYNKKVNMSFLPIVNPTGVSKQERYNKYGENPNSGFCHVGLKDNFLSREGKILVKNIDMLISLAKNGFVSLHEDVDYSKFYLYTFENSKKPGKFTKCLYNAEKKFFKPVPNSVVTTNLRLIEGGQVINGIIYKECDGSFEDRLFHEGVPFTACTETPGKLALSKRIKANSTILESFVNFFIP